VATNDPLVNRYVLPGVPTPLLADDIANKAYVDASGGGGLGDLEFLRDKELAGDLVSSSIFSSANSPVTGAVIIPAAGKTFFIAGHSSILINNTGSSRTEGRTLLENNTVTVYVDVAFLNGNGTDNVVHVGSPNVIKGDSLVGDGAVEYRQRKTVGLANFNFATTIMGWIQDT